MGLFTRLAAAGAVASVVAAVGARLTYQHFLVASQKCRTKLHDARGAVDGGVGFAGPSEVIVLRDGRQLGYLRVHCGAEPKPVVFVFHGYPDSRLTVAAMPADFMPGVCVIGVDRPGFGLSCFHPDCTVSDFASDVLELADALGVERFGVVGISGGGPSAAALHAKAPSRVIATVDLCGIGPMDSVPNAFEGMEPMNKFLFAYAPAALHGPLCAAMSYTMPRDVPLSEENVDQMMASAPQADRDVLKANAVARQVIPHSFHESMRCGFAGIVHEQRLDSCYASWGFTLEDVARNPAPFTIVQGTEDANVPASHARWYHAGVPHARLVMLPGEGHLSAIFGAAALEVWRDFAATVKGA